MGYDRRDYASEEARQWQWCKESAKENGLGNLPIRMEVCGTCDGRGKYVNPGIDSNGLSQSDFDEDPDFGESYWRGDYDMTCEECHGHNVVEVLDEEFATDEQKDFVNDWHQDYVSDRAERAAEAIPASMPQAAPVATKSIYSLPQSIVLWFLIGAFFALLIYFILGYFRKEYH